MSSFFVLLLFSVCHTAEGSVTSKRISLLFNHSRCRSFSESWAFLSPSSNVTRPPAQTFDRKPSKSMSTLLLSSSSSSSDEDESSHSMESFGSDTPSSVATTPTSSSPVPAAHSSSSKDSNSRATTANTDYKDLPDQELLKSLAAFLKGHNNSEVEEEEGVSSMCRRSKDPSRVNALCKASSLIWLFLT
ncbi:hypothetical protein EDD21DRAFT_118704 [Dissophora ornata]|nr:hypothetical protein EDD21DRAFT_118704 [Dissophora ornata]